MNPAIVLAIVALFFPAVATARTHTVTLLLHSTPEGAQVMINTVPTAMGATPLALKYTFPGDCVRTQPVVLRWTSGAEVRTALDLCAKTGKRQQITIARPADIAGLEIDVQVAYQQAMLAQMQALTRAVNDPPPPVMPPIAIPRQVTCLAVPVIGGGGATYISCR